MKVKRRCGGSKEAKQWENPQQSSQSASYKETGKGPQSKVLQQLPLHALSLLTNVDWSSYENSFQSLQAVIIFFW